MLQNLELIRNRVGSVREYRTRSAYVCAERIARIRTRTPARIRGAGQESGAPPHGTRDGRARVVDLGLMDDEIVCDGEQVVQTLLALMINGIEAMPGGRDADRIDGAGPRGRPVVLLSVSDTGQGIPGEIQDRIFDPFFSTKNETERGWSRTRGRVRDRQAARRNDHGGLQSRHGTTFTIRLPRRPEDRPLLERGAASGRWGRDRR